MDWEGGPARETVETGNEPEFVIYDVARWEDAGNGLIRILISSKHGNINRGEYWIYASPERMMHMASKCQKFAVEAMALGYGGTHRH